MCLAIPARIVELLDGDQCRVELGGVRKQVSLALVDGIAVGDYGRLSSDTPSASESPVNCMTPYSRGCRVLC